jgi:(S)-ureidoglycine aminohydrolase
MYKSIIFAGLIILAALPVCSQQSLISSAYYWEKAAVKKTTYGEEREFLNGPSRSLELFTIKAFTVRPMQSIGKHRVEQGSDELLIIKEGSASVKINGENVFLSAGSVAVAVSGDSVGINNIQNENMVIYSICFKPSQKEARKNPVKPAAPIFTEWKNVVFSASSTGGRRNIMQGPTYVLDELEIHVTTVNEGKASHSGHIHPDEEIILVRYGNVEMTINDKPFICGPGSVIFLTMDDFHGLKNA